jgi:hypothetical protein
MSIKIPISELYACYSNYHAHNKWYQSRVPGTINHVSATVNCVPMTMNHVPATTNSRNQAIYEEIRKKKLEIVAINLAKVKESISQTKSMRKTE